MIQMKPHEGETSQKTWDIVDDMFDLGLLAFALFWEFTGTHFDESLLSKVALTGASVRIASWRRSVSMGMKGLGFRRPRQFRPATAAARW